MREDVLGAAPGRGRRRGRAGGALTGVALLLAALLLAACTGAQDDGEPAPDPQAGDGAAVDEEPVVDLDEALDAGEAIRQERFTVTVEGLDCEPAAAAGAEVEASGRFCVLTLGLTNETDGEQSIEPDRQVLLDEAGTEYAYMPEATEELAGEPIEDVPAGEARTVRLVYDVPEDTPIVAARISDDADAEGVVVDLMP